MNKEGNILIAPLDWGLGHASRCVPIIQKLLDRNENVIIGADKRPYDYLAKEFPGVKMIRLPGFEVSYPSDGKMVKKMISLSPKFINSTKREHKLFETLIEDYNLKTVISDNRYGLWSDRIFSVLITHQLMIKTPKEYKFAEPFLYTVTKSVIKRFDECWVPDYKGKINLSGDLSHKYKSYKNTHFIGPLSRFNFCEEEIEHDPEELLNDLLFIISGPEPQRSIFEEKVLKQLENCEYKAVVVRGVTEKEQEEKLNENVKIISNATTSELQKLIKESDLIVSRPGYSTIMDLAALGKKAAFVPTPGQTEQEYLAKNFKTKKVFYAMRQKKFSIQKMVDQSEDYQGLKLSYNPSLLDERIDHLLEQANELMKR